MQHFREKLLDLVAVDLTKLINKDKCTKTTELYKRWHNIWNLEPKFYGWRLVLFRAKILGLSCCKPNKGLMDRKN